MRLNRRASLLCYLLLAACGGGGATAPVDAAIVGSYQLQTINGFAVPAVYVQSATGKVEILDDVYTLNADRTYTEAGHTRTTYATGAVTLSAGVDAGTFTSGNGTVQLVSNEGNGTSSGTMGGGTLTIVDQGASLVYKKQ